MITKEDFVGYDLAVKLKQKGFKDLCFAYYTNTNDLYFNYSHKAGAKYSDCYLSHNLMPKDSVSGKFVDAPTISKVLNWLIEEKKFYVVPLICSDWSENADGIICEEWLFWSYQVININDGRIVYNEMNKIDNGNFENYEQAALAGIEYVLDNLI